MSLSKEECASISDAIRAAEARTSGEIVCVLAQSSSHFAALPILLAAVLALALPWILVAFTGMTVHRILSLQVIVFLLVAGVLSLPRVQVTLIPPRARRAAAHRVAVEQFMIRGIARKQDRSGLLIFVSLAEHYARIIADDGIAARVPSAHWRAAVDALIAHMREGRIADGFVAAIGLCGDELAEHFPRDGTGRHELPDRIYLI
jgi:putative membrane protein